MKDLKDHITENSIEYVLVGDYYIPQLELPTENRPIGQWGRQRKNYLRENRPALYNQLILTGKLQTHLADVNEQAEERLERIIDQMAQAEGVTEELKARDQMEWVRQMNSIHHRAEKPRSGSTFTTDLLLFIIRPSMT